MKSKGRNPKERGKGVKRKENLEFGMLVAHKDSALCIKFPPNGAMKYDH
jgi:hypothetical protein